MTFRMKSHDWDHPYSILIVYLSDIRMGTTHSPYLGR